MLISRERPHSAGTLRRRKEYAGLRLKAASGFFLIFVLAAAAAILFLDISAARGHDFAEKAGRRTVSAQIAAADMMAGLDYLTDRARCFVMTGEIRYLREYYEETNVTRRREGAAETFELLLDGADAGAQEDLKTALALSDDLAGIEEKAMRLVLEAGEYDLPELPEEIAGAHLSPEDRALSDEELINKAQGLVFGDDYVYCKDLICRNVRFCTETLVRVSGQEQEHASAKLELLADIRTLLTTAVLVSMLFFAAVITVRLRSEASHDALTGLFNRGAYDLLMKSVDKEHMALLLIDVDHFKRVNDTYGHAVGDRVLKRVADILRHSFRSVDILCRIGGDEFAVVMTRANSSMRRLVIDKIHDINEQLQDPEDGLPPVTLSVGAAFSDRENPQGDIFHDADTALYRAKEAGRRGCQVYE